MSRRLLLGNDLTDIRLRRHIVVPTKLRRGIVKCRIVCDEVIDDISYTQYQKKNIQSLKIVDGKSIDYKHKYKDRSNINLLYKQKESCDDIIITKDGKLTDSSYSNIALLRNKIWYTPEENLLSGTKREQLINQGRLVVKSISISELHNFSHVSLINAMNNLMDIVIPIEKVIM